MCSWISPEEKSFPNVDLASLRPGNLCLDKFVQDQAASWEVLWRPKEVDPAPTASAFSALYHTACDLPQNEESIPQPELHKCASGYKKNSLGTDLWNSKHELAELPSVAFGPIVDAVNKAVEVTTIPHQQL